ncbi:MAG: type VI secretion system accessory protein TagJ [Candidatus Methylumidiphilus sp.]
MLAEQYLREGDLAKALAELQKQVRENPANPKLRVFLFQLLAVLGQWDRAQTQLKLAGDLDAANLLMAQTYREAMLCEALRAEVFAGRRTPLVFGDPQHWLALLLEALRLDGLGHAAAAQDLRGQAFADAPATPGTFNGAAFEWIADADSRLGPVLEAIVNGRYYWFPFQQIQSITLEAPADLRDVVWTPAEFVWANGGGASGLIPTRYSGTEASTDALLQLARKTEWQEFFAGAYQGTGQRLLATNVGDYALMDARAIQFGQAEAP